ncbi:MAG: hypothetical protein EZS28_054417, partial [Streblomastix strix]
MSDPTHFRSNYIPINNGDLLYVLGILNQIIATKIIPLEKFELGEWKSVDILWRVEKSCPFILDYIRHYNQGFYIIVLTEYANMKTLNIIAKQQKKPPVPLPSYIFRALFKQILVGMQIFHAAGLVHWYIISIQEVLVP